jgi:beta-lactamase superfamily II metal-dependent hydrolase
MQNATRKEMIKCLFFLTFLLFRTPDLCAQLKVFVIDVGQGDAIYIELPSGRNALIDGGPKAELLVNFLNQKGVKALDNVVLTHPHSDHYNGLRAVLSGMPVKSFYDTKMDNLNSAVDDQMREDVAAKAGCEVRYPEAGEQLDWDPQVSVQVLHSCPFRVATALSYDINNCSIVLQMRYNGNSILFMGDAQSSTEDEIMDRFGAGIQSNILKVAHHGAPNTSTPGFLAAVKPRYAYIPVGLDNPFGHPSIDTLSNLRAAGATVFMTTSGTQSFTIPAPRGVPYAEPVFNAGDMTPSAEFADMTLTGPGPSDAVDPGLPALNQLAEQAGAAK